LITKINKKMKNIFDQNIAINMEIDPDMDLSKVYRDSKGNLSIISHDVSDEDRDDHGRWTSGGTEDDSDKEQENIDNAYKEHSEIQDKLDAVDKDDPSTWHECGAISKQESEKISSDKEAVEGFDEADPSTWPEENSLNSWEYHGYTKEGLEREVKNHQENASYWRDKANESTSQEDKDKYEGYAKTQDSLAKSTQEKLDEGPKENYANKSEFINQQIDDKESGFDKEDPSTWEDKSKASQFESLKDAKEGFDKSDPDTFTEHHGFKVGEDGLNDAQRNRDLIDEREGSFNDDDKDTWHGSSQELRDQATKKQDDAVNPELSGEEQDKAQEEHDKLADKAEENHDQYIKDLKEESKEYSKQASESNKAITSQIKVLQEEADSDNQKAVSTLKDQLAQRRNEASSSIKQKKKGIDEAYKKVKSKINELERRQKELEPIFN
jgi:hypothetical protein